MTLAELLTRLAPYTPTLIGTFPLGLQVEGSDLDIACEAHDLDAFSRSLAREGRRVGNAFVSAFELDGMPVEVWAEPLPVAQQHGFRHMVIEGRLLALFELRDRVLALKRAGLKTEPAFAQLLGLEGDPYQAILSLEALSALELQQRFQPHLLLHRSST